MNKNRVLFVLNSLVIMGGVEQTTLDNAKYLASQGLEVEVCALRRIGKIAERYEEAGIKVHNFPLYAPGNGDKMKYSWGSLLKYRRFLKEQGYGIIVCGQQTASYLTRLACFPGTRRRIFVLECTQTWVRNRVQRTLDWLCSHWTTQIVCISGDVMDGLVAKSRISPRRACVIELGYPRPSHIPPPFTHPQLTGKFVFGCVSRLDRMKRQDIIILAFQKLHQQRPDTALLLVGGGDADESLRQLAQQLDIADAVVFTGETPETSSYYECMDCFVFASVSEGLGGVFIEAWHHKLPLICSDIRPMNTYVQHGHSGLLFERDNPTSLAEQMLTMIDDKPLRQALSSEGHQAADEYFNFDRQAHRYYQLYTGQSSSS